MIKTKTVEATASWTSLKKGEVFILIKRFFYNGEGWIKVKDVSGNIKEFPEVFFFERDL